MLSFLGVMLSFFGSYTKRMTYFKWAEMLAFLLFRVLLKIVIFQNV